MSFNIGSIQITDPVFLAPMSGVTDLPYRRMVKRFGAGLVFSEMIASRPMLEQFKRAPQKTTSENYAEEFPMAVQLAGCEPEIMAEAARLNVDRGAAIIDINFGCPVKKIVTNFAGSALMRDEVLAGKIMEETVRAVDVPVTVKMRLGWDEHSINAANLARIAENCGIKMITVHGRTRNQLYTGNADWAAIRAVKDAVSIPVIVNGDIICADNARNAIELSGADGVMVGRGTYGKPWVVRQIMDYFRGVPMTPTPSITEIEMIIREHYEMLLAHYGEHQGVAIARKHIGWYCKDMPGSETLRSEINQMLCPQSVLERLRRYFGDLSEGTALLAA